MRLTFAGNCGSRGRSLPIPAPSTPAGGQAPAAGEGTRATGQQAPVHAPLDPAHHARGAPARLATEGHGQRPPAFLAAEQKETLVWVSAQQELVQDALDVTANGTVRPLVTLLVVPEEGLQMVGHQLSG